MLCCQAMQPTDAGCSIATPSLWTRDTPPHSPVKEGGLLSLRESFMEGESTPNTEYLSNMKGSHLVLCTHVLVTDPCRKALLLAPSSTPGRRETEAQELGEQKACIRAENEAGPQGHRQHAADCSCHCIYYGAEIRSALGDAEWGQQCASG